MSSASFTPIAQRSTLLLLVVAMVVACSPVDGAAMEDRVASGAGASSPVTAAPSAQTNSAELSEETATHAAEPGTTPRVAPSALSSAVPSDAGGSAGAPSSAAAASATPQRPFAMNLYRKGDFVAQYTFEWCVGASLQMALNLTTDEAHIFAVISTYPDIGPRAHFTPRELAYQRANAQRAGHTALEPSAESHLSALRDGISTVLHHPQGYGLGNAGEVAFREHVPLKAGESNYTELGVETGLLGALLFVAWNLALLAGLIRRREGALAAMFAAVLFVAIQTDAYGIPWLAYCVWWLAASGLDERA